MTKTLSHRQSTGLVLVAFFWFIIGIIAGASLGFPWMMQSAWRLIFGAMAIACFAGLYNTETWCDLAKKKKRVYFGGYMTWFLLFWIPATEYVSDTWSLTTWGEVLFRLVVCFFFATGTMVFWHFVDRDQ